mgnify:CR=1 FL=1
MIATGATKEEVERAQVQSEQNKISFQQLDVRDANAVQDCIEEIDSLDVLVNCAGVIRRNAEHEPEVFADVIDINLNGSMRVCAAAREKLKQRKGCIINMASTRALQSEPHCEAYAAAKGGLLAMTHALAVSLGPEVRVNAICPGWIETGPWQKSSQRSTPVHRTIDREQHPAGRIGEPEDIAAAVAFLAGDEAGFITGQEFVIDGGMTRKMIYQH